MKQPAAQPLKVPPPVKAKPAKVHQPSAVTVVSPTTNDFPAPPPDMMKPSSVEDELDALTDMLTLGLENTTDPDFFGK